MILSNLRATTKFRTKWIVHNVLSEVIITEQAIQRSPVFQIEICGPAYSSVRSEL